MGSALGESSTSTAYGNIIVNSVTYLLPTQDMYSVLPNVLPLPTVVCFDLRFLFLLCFLGSTFLLMLTLALEFYGDFHHLPITSLFFLRFRKDVSKKTRSENQVEEEDLVVHKIEVVEDDDGAGERYSICHDDHHHLGSCGFSSGHKSSIASHQMTAATGNVIDVIV